MFELSKQMKFNFVINNHEIFQFKKFNQAILQSIKLNDYIFHSFLKTPHHFFNISLLMGLTLFFLYPLV